MARQQRRKARKDYPDHGIKKGDVYYFAQLKTGPRSSRILRSLKPLRESELTVSAFKSQWYAADETLADADPLSGDAVRDVASEIDNLGTETRDARDAMPESLQWSPTGEMLEQRAEACESAATELEDIAGRIEDVTGHDYDEEEDRESDLEDLANEAREVLSNNEPE